MYGESCASLASLPLCAEAFYLFAINLAFGIRAPPRQPRAAALTAVTRGNNRKKIVYIERERESRTRQLRA